MNIFTSLVLGIQRGGQNWKFISVDHNKTKKYKNSNQSQKTCRICHYKSGLHWDTTFSDYEVATSLADNIRNS